MTTVMAPIRAEHRELKPHIEQLRRVADNIATQSVIATAGQVDEVIDFLGRHLVPHAMAEDQVLYPAVAQAMGSPRATATMSRDHVAVVHLLDELTSLRPALAEKTDAPVLNDLRRILYGLYALLLVHFAKEEEIYLPLLEDRLTAVEASTLIANMERAAARAKVLKASALAR